MKIDEILKRQKEAFDALSTAYFELSQEYSDALQELDRRVDDIHDAIAEARGILGDIEGDYEEEQAEIEETAMMWQPIADFPDEDGMYLLHQVWPSGKSFVFAAQYRNGEWRSWDDIEVVGLPLTPTQRDLITHFALLREP